MLIVGFLRNGAPLTRARRRARFTLPPLAFVVASAMLGFSVDGVMGEDANFLYRRDGLVSARNHVVVTLNDSYKLFSDPIFESAKTELESIFAKSGGSVTLLLARSGEHPRKPIHSLAVNAVAMPLEPRRWGLARNAMAAVIREPNKLGAIYVFAPRFETTLGYRSGGTGGPRDPSESFLAGRALGRVLAHELVHLLLPESPHTEAGLMASRLNRHLLTRRELSLDSNNSLRLNLAVWEQGRFRSRVQTAAISPETRRVSDPRRRQGPVMK